MFLSLHYIIQTRLDHFYGRNQTLSGCGVWRKFCYQLERYDCPLFYLLQTRFCHQVWQLQSTECKNEKSRNCFDKSLTTCLSELLLKKFHSPTRRPEGWSLAFWKGKPIRAIGGREKWLLLQHRHPRHHVDTNEGGIVQASQSARPCGARLVLGKYFSNEEGKM